MDREGEVCGVRKRTRMEAIVCLVGLWVNDGRMKRWMDFLGDTVRTER